MTTHDCPECGLTHSIPEHGDSEAVRIATINAKRDIEVARLQRAETRLETETALEQTEIITEGETEVAVIEAESGVEAAEAVADALAPPEPEPEIVEVPAAAADDPGETEDEAAAPGEVEKKAPASGGGYWSGYSAS
jgi:hypothetical protein